MSRGNPKIKISKEELETNEVLELSDQIVAWIYANYRLLVYGLAGFFAIFAVILFFQQRTEARLASGNDLLYEATMKFEEGLGQHGWATVERRDAMIEVIRLSNRVIDEFSGDRPLVQSALFLKANAYFFAGDLAGDSSNTDEAIRFFEDYLSQVNRNREPMNYAAALLALGYANENRFFLTNVDSYFNSAMQNFDRLIAMSDQEAGFLRYEAMNGKARNLAFQGNVDEAKSLYLEVVRNRRGIDPFDYDNASDREALVASLKELAGQFTTAQTARTQLVRLGMDPDEIDELAAASR